MVPLNMRRELIQTAGRALEAAASLSDRERLELAHEWSALFGAGSIPAGLPQATAPEAAPEGFKDEIDLAREILRRLAIGLERWPWGGEEKAGSRPRWPVDDEFHVQSLLWLALAPALPGLAYEECLPAIGRTRPRMDLALPGAELAIEAKFIRAPRDFARVTEAIAADSALYTTALPERYSRMIAVVWDDSRSTERYEGFVEGLKALRGVIDAFVIARPGRMGDPKARRSKAAKPSSARSASR